MRVYHSKRSLVPARIGAIEVIIAVIVIVLAVAVFLPSISRPPPGGARRAVCMSNLKQCGLAMMMYSTANNGLMAVASSPGELGWVGAVARNMGVRYARTISTLKDANEMRFEPMEWFRCPERSGNSLEFIDYVSNALDPAGPDAGGVWPSPVNRKFAKVSDYAKPDQVILLSEAEREDKVVDFKDLASVKTAHDQWRQGPTGWQQGGVHNMTIWKGGHLPEGKNGINVDDKPGPRKVAREMHVGGNRTNALFFDGHVASQRLSSNKSELGRYADWLKRFGVKDPDKVAASDDDLY